MKTKIFEHKWVIFIVFCLVIVLFDALAVNISIVNRGIIIGMAIDKKGEGIEVTVQLMLPKNGGVNGGGNNYLIISAEDSTLQGCLGQLTQKIGSTLSMSHTVVLIMGRELLEGGGGDIVEKIMVKDVMNDSLLLCMAQDKAKDILASSIAYAEATSFQLQRMMMPVKHELGQTGITMKQYMVDNYDEKSANFLPIIYTEKGKPSSDQGKEGLEEVDILRMKSVAIIGDGGYITELEGDAMDGLTILKNSLDGGVINVIGDGGVEVGIKVVKAQSAVEYSLENNIVRYAVDIKVIRETASSGKGGKLDYKLSDMERNATVKAVEKMIVDCYGQLADNNADCMLVYEGFYRKYGEKWVRNSSESYLQDIKCETLVKLSER